MSEIPSTALLGADDPSVANAFAPQRWGIFNSAGQPVLVSDSVSAVEYTREYDISDYPQEQGAFFSYNKVQLPYQAKITLLSNQTREQLLNTLETVTASLALVSVVTPEITYPSANVIRYGFRRTQEHGVTLIAVDVWCEEVRLFSSPGVNGASQQQQANGGNNLPVGQLNSASNVAPGSSASGNLTNGNGVTPPSLAALPGDASASTIPPPSLAALPGDASASTIPPAAITSGSTNAATPTVSGPVQSIPAAQANAFLNGSLGGIPNPAPPLNPPQ